MDPMGLELQHVSEIHHFQKGSFSSTRFGSPTKSHPLIITITTVLTWWFQSQNTRKWNSMKFPVLHFDQGKKIYDRLAC